MKRVSIKVHGKVQGVFYRANTEKVARKIGVTGFVQNEPDGSVYIEAQGSEQQLEELIDWCKRGPERAVVEKVETSGMPTQAEEKFRLIR